MSALVEYLNNSKSWGYGSEGERVFAPETFSRTKLRLRLGRENSERNVPSRAFTLSASNMDDVKIV